MNKRLEEIGQKSSLFIIEVLLIVLTMILMQCSVLINSVNAETATGSDGDVSWSFDSETGTLTFSGSGEITEGWKKSGVGAKNVKKVIISEGITGIGNDAFRSCTSITNIEIPTSITSIGEGAFSWCTSLTSITIPDSVAEIGKIAFAGCTSLESIEIPSSVTSIGEGTFGFCENLMSINIDKNNANYTSVDGVLFNKDKTAIVCYPAGKTQTNYSIPNSVTSIENCAFVDCTWLINVEISNGLISIGKEAFEECTSLTNITIPDSVKSIGICAFLNCTSLTSINVDDNNANYSSVDGVLFNKNKTTIVCYPEGKTQTNYSIPSSVTNIEDRAFVDCLELINVEIPNTVTNIGVGAFYGCRNLTRITIPNSVSSIGLDAFIRCQDLVIYCNSNSVAERYAIDNSIGYVIDDDVPVIEEVNQDGLYIKISATDNDGVGLDKYPYSIDGQHWFSNNSIAVEKSGTYTVYVRDKLGNIAIKDDVEVKIKDENDNNKENESDANKDKENNEQNQTKGDVTAPIIKDIQVNGFIIKIIAEDSESGLAEKAYSLDNKTWQSSNEIKVEKDGQYMVYVRDKEGNIAKKLVVIEPKEENSNNSDSTNNNGSTNKNDNKATTDTNNAEDKTVTPAKKLPQTGVNLLIPITLITIAGIVAISYKKFKSIKLK